MHKAPLSPVSDPAGTWQVYVLHDWKNETPWYSHASRLEDLSRVPDGRYLVWHRPDGKRRPGYWIAQVRDNTVRAVSQDRIERADVRRLLYSLDSVFEYPLHMRVRHQETGRWRLDQLCGLPLAEERLLVALATREITPSKSFPVFWHFSDCAAVTDAISQLEQIGIVVEHHHEATGDNR